MAEPYREEDLDSLINIISAKEITNLLGVAMDLEIFPSLKGKALNLAEAAQTWKLQTSSARALAQGLCYLKLLHYNEGLLSNGPIVENILLQDPLSWEYAYKQSHDPPEPVEKFKERLVHPKPQAWYQIRDEGKQPEEANLNEGFYENLHDIRIRWGHMLATSYDFSNHKQLLDVGGATGGWCMGVRERFPHMQGIVFDIAPATKVADKLIAKAGLQGKIKTVTGNFFDDELPKGADAVLLANVLHDWTIDDCRQILRRVHQALPVGGVVLVCEYYFEDDWTASSWMAVGQAFAVNGQQGKCGWQPTYGEMEKLLQDEGFAQTSRGPRLVIGEKR